jgi:serine/threonine protein kinase
VQQQLHCCTSISQPYVGCGTTIMSIRNSGWIHRYTLFNTSFTSKRMMSWSMFHIKLKVAISYCVVLFVQAKGMNYLHKRNPPIVHRDLKSPNLLVDKKYTVKVWTFCFSFFQRTTFAFSYLKWHCSNTILNLIIHDCFLIFLL